MLNDDSLALPGGVHRLSAAPAAASTAPEVWAPPAAVDAGAAGPRVILSFDLERHDTIEAAAQLPLDPAMRSYYQRRLHSTTRWLLDELGRHGIRATFFVVGQVARDDPALIRAIHRDGHELAIHSWGHRRVHHHTPASFRADVRQCRDELEQVSGAPVVGYRAPTFSIVRQTAWALDELAELGLTYDSSIYPVWHDRYGVPRAPRGPFLAGGERHAILEVPPATYRLLGVNLPAAGGGTFRLLPLYFLRKALRQAENHAPAAVAMLYFHPWEFDAGQVRLPLGWLGRLRTYTGIGRTRTRLAALFAGFRFTRAIDVARQFDRGVAHLPYFRVAA
jgi:polysaccharide deacetylase family protein (PEP-CTERM system associated)